MTYRLSTKDSSGSRPPRTGCVIRLHQVFGKLPSTSVEVATIDLRTPDRPPDVNLS